MCRGTFAARIPDAVPDDHAAFTVLAVPHQELMARPLSDLAAKTVRGGCLVDVKSKLDPEAVKSLGLRVWRL